MCISLFLDCCRHRSIVGYTARLPALFFAQSWTSAMSQSRRYHLCLSRTQDILLRFGHHLFVWQFRDPRDRSPNATCCIHFYHFTSPPRKLNPAPASYGRVFATRDPTIGNKSATSQQKASFPSRQHRRYYHHHNNHQPPCQANPPTSWPRSSCGYASAFSH